MTRLLLLCCVFLTLTAYAQSAPLASLEARVVGKPENAPLPGAVVRIDGRGTIADGEGRFAFAGLSPGHHLLEISSADHQPLQLPVELAPGANTLPFIALEREVVQLEKMEVVGQTTGAASAFADKTGSDSLTEVVSGAALKNPTARSASDLLKNVVGVTVVSGTDGSTKILVRGMDSRFVRVTVDGQRQGGGSNALDSIPPEIVQSLEISKALTPDMDADAIGGAINVTTGAANLREAYVQGRDQITYNSLEPRPGTRNSVTAGRPFRLFSKVPDKPNAGFLLTASFDDQYRRWENVRDLREWPSLLSPGPAPYAGQLVPVLTQPRIESSRGHRQLTALVFNADARFGDSSFFWRSNFTRDWGRRDRNIDDFDPATGTPLVLTPDHAVFSGVTVNRRNMWQTVQRDAANFTLGGRTTVGRVDLDATLGVALTDENEPHTLETVFSSDHTFRTTYDTRPNSFLPQFSFVDETNPADTASISDPAHYDFNNLVVSRSDTKDHEYAARLNAKLNLGDPAQQDYLKFGGKLQQRHRQADIDRVDYDPGVQSRTMTGLVGSPMVTLHTGGYSYGPIPGAGAVDALLGTAPSVFQLNQTDTRINSTTGDYSATETIWAAYGMGRFKVDHWTILGGVRTEGTRVTSRANQLVFAPDGSLQSITPARAARSYMQVLPGLHLRFDPQPGLVFRSSVTRALNRPNYGDLVPAQQTSFIDRRTRVGNPGLKPYEATNVDLSVDKYSDKTGLLSLSLFFKKIDHFIADAQFPVTLGSLGQFIEFQRVNGDSARVWGVESGWQSPKWNLPGQLGSSSLVLNYTFLHSETHFPNRPGETFPLADQAAHQGSCTLSSEFGRLSVDVTLRYRSKILEDVIAPGFDNYRIGAFDAEIGLAYKLGRDVRLTFGASNLLNFPSRNYSGDYSRMNEYQRSGIDLNLGVQWKLPIGAASSRAQSN